MANIRLDLVSPVYDGQTLTFKSPANCSTVTGLIVYYPNGTETASKTFQFADAHGNNVGSVDLFASGVLVNVIIDTEQSRAYVQNADTNKYLEQKFAGKANATHASQHASGGSDPITPASIGAATMAQVNSAISTAITGAIEGSY